MTLRQQSKTRPGACRAFTLIELLLAVAVFATILAAINGIFYAALHLQITTNAVIEEVLPAELAITALKHDIAGTVLPGGQLAGSMVCSSSSGLMPATGAGLTGPISLELFTSSGVLMDDVPWGEIQKVDYSLENSRSRTQRVGRDLVRSVTRNLLSTATTTPEVYETQRLLEHVDKLTFSFFDGTNWLDTWGGVTDTTTTNAVPIAVRVHIDIAVERSSRVEKPPIEFIVPVPASMAYLTNNTPTTTQ